MNIKQYAFIGCGGMIGATARYSLSLMFAAQSGFPYATLFANLMGCFLLSFLMNQQTIRRKLNPAHLTAINTGVIGSFTTFSTFAVETIELLNNQLLLAVIYVAASIVLSLLFCYGGYQLATRRQVES